ncbi:hypothetical protein OHA18_25510 [Kribbella sp. NBC_00709]|uniref:hypothetical protein n=1 Tax=Kribbella sp. NBC_00709 TaxID=2975972 RepID=UPI002E2E628A|nr:hypothetical protein [Kribbella sp. NBC_00709]
MTFDPDPDDDWMRAAVKHSQDLHTSSPVPLDEILSAGQAHKKRRNVTAMVAVAAVVAIVAIGTPLSWRRPASTPSQVTPAAIPSQRNAPVDATVGHGVVDGLRWSVVLEFYPTLPAGYVSPAKAEDVAGKSSLVCQRMVIGGVRIDHQGGPWADCQPVTGAHDPSQTGGAGLWGLQDKGTHGSRLFVANVGVAVAYGIVNLSDGTQLKSTATTVPGTSYRAFAIAITAGKSITSVDTYNTTHHRLTHDTSWR